MRITNSMTSNNMLLNLQKNMAAVSKLQYQAVTGNKIQYASDDPIVAGRALKFRTNLSEANQYLENTNQAVSWMQVTASAVKNIQEVMYSGENSIRSRLVASSNGTATIDDRKKYMLEIQELLSELTGEVNADYAGRYIFSGYRTDEPPVFKKEEAGKSFNITQAFSSKDIKQTEIYTKDASDSGAMPESHKVYSLKLAYENGITGVSGLTYTTKNSVTDTDAYKPADNEIFYLQDKGEFIFGKTAYENAVSTNQPISIDYKKTGFASGDLNPVNYFDCKDLISGKSYQIGNQAIKYELGTNNQTQINSFAKDILTPDLLSDIKQLSKLVQNTNISSERDLRIKYTALGYGGEALEKAIKKQTDDENKLYNDVIGNRMSELIGKMDKHSFNVSKENTLIGGRLVRATLIEQRLLDDRINFETLKTENESVDMEEVLIRLNSQTTVYSSALQIGAKLAQMSLVNFVN